MHNTPISTEETAEAIAVIRCELEAYIDPVKREYLPRFFKTGKGQYGEGDRFLGVVVPNTRLVAKRHKDKPFEVMAGLLQSEWHECRLCALLMLVERFRKCDETERKAIFEFYLAQTGRINNWDLVDLSAPGIVGEYLKDKPRDVLYRLADSPLLWDKRIAVVSTYTFIKNNDFIDIIRLSEHLLYTSVHIDAHSAHIPAHSVRPLHDLMQKAIGWMLREMGKRDKDLLVQFLEKHGKEMPRTALRYAIEKFPEEERREFMKR
ncbi:MAG: DNA alkylation repair protein [Bacteroides helcogenes]|nr:DNA alkylation repair protein [Bacteroides helcogenes]MDY5239498.1 DNA alkylation repair protein [Bacteroides helcogenes]